MGNISKRALFCCSSHLWDRQWSGTSQRQVQREGCCVDLWPLLGCMWTERGDKLHLEPALLPAPGALCLPITHLHLEPWLGLFSVSFWHMVPCVWDLPGSWFSLFFLPSRGCGDRNPEAHLIGHLLLLQVWPKAPHSLHFTCEYQV